MPEPRTLLFAPGDNPRRMQKAATSGADVTIVDLEDAVVHDAKPTARRNVREFLNHRDENTPLYVRVNALDTPELRADLDVLAEALVHATGVVLPKAESRAQLEELNELLGGIERSAGSPNKLAVIAILESAQGVLAAYDVATGPRVNHLVFGTFDLSAELGIIPSNDGHELHPLQSQVVLASRAAHLGGPIDGPHRSIDDAAGLADSMRSAQRRGFRGKVVLHPAQIAPVHEVLQPSSAELSHARRVLDAYTEASRQGLGAVQLDDGTFIDRPVVLAAAEILGIDLKEISV